MRTRINAANPTIRVLALALATLMAGAVQAQYAIGWSSLDGGGGTSSGGRYTVSGTIGQSAPGALAAGDYALEGGLWPGLIVEPGGQEPTLHIQSVGAGVQIGWAPATAGFALETSADLQPETWLPAPDGNPVTIEAGEACRFFRLRKR